MATIRPKPARRAQKHFSYCSLRPFPPRALAPNVGPERAGVILLLSNKWVNGTTLRYHLFKSPAQWTASDAEKNIVRKAFQLWKDVGIGLEFKEVDSPAEAEVKIGFQQGDGAWSYIGRDILQFGATDRTMNFGWRLAGSPPDLDTAIHEIGHTIGFPHEHQNPNAGIVWDEEAVYTALAAPPNRWARDKTFHNIIEKIRPDTVQGSSWDPDSVMHYPFEAGLIQQPEKYRSGLTPAGGISARDHEWIKTFYPPIGNTDYTTLVPTKSLPLSLAAGQQKNFRFAPTTTRNYEMRTFGPSDTVMVLFEDVNGELRYKAGDDDSGEDRNAYLKARLYKGRKYVLRIRMYYEQSAGETGVMLW